MADLRSSIGAGDFSELVRTHQGVIRAFLTRLTRDSALADDLAQDCFMKAHGQITQLKNPKAAKAWLFQIAYRTYSDHARKEARRRGLREINFDPAEDGVETPAGTKMDIEAAMNRLHPEVRAVIMMCLSYGMSHSEASLASGLPLGTVKSHINRGREKLRAFLAAYERV